MTGQIPLEVAERLGHYVYLLVDPADGKAFYVGKGQGERALAHLGENADSRKCVRIRELRAAGREPRIDILQHGLPDEATAFRIEAAVIDALGLNTLTNEVRGSGSTEAGRISLRELTLLYAAKPVTVEVPALLIRINQLYRPDMPEKALFEATRGVWRLGRRCEKARYAFAVFGAVVREVYAIDSWHAAGTTPYETRDVAALKTNGRREFLGRPADPEIRDAHVGRSVAAQFRQGLQSPVVYVNC